VTVDPTKLTPAPGPDPAPPVRTLAPFEVPEYRRMWGAAVVSHVGTFLQLTAAPWLMTEMTGSPLLVSLVTTALTLPRLLLTLPAGALADVVDRRTLLLAGQSFSTVAVAAMAVLTTLDLLTPAWLLGLTFALGVGSAIAMPSFQTLVPDLVPRPLMAQAITLNSAAFNVARAVGPALGGLLVAAGLASTAFGANAVSYLAVIGVLLTFPRSTVEDPSRQGLWRSTALGVRYARFTRPIRVLLGVTAVFAFTTASVQSLLPVVTTELGLGAMGFGALYALFGTGALTAVTLRERARVRFGRRMLPGSVLGFGVAGLVFGLAPVPAVAGAGLLAAGLFWVWTMTTLNATIQLLAPRWVRGRVVSLYVLAIGLQPAGAFAAGWLAEWSGAGVAVAAFTAGTAALGLVAFRLGLPVLGQLDEPVPPEDWTVPQHARHVGGSPVVVATTWEVDRDEVHEFLAVMRQLRRQRFRTGAHRWSLYRDADRPTRITEFFVLHDWEEHLAQHARIDAEAAAVLARARAFDRAGGPVTRHLAGLDVVDDDAPPIEEQLLTVHEELHRTDGSVPLGDERSEEERQADRTSSARGPRPSSDSS
jgi:MFS family permease